jgi:hypothetical protein
MMRGRLDSLDTRVMRCVEDADHLLFNDDNFNQRNTKWAKTKSRHALLRLIRPM